jgi:hypothetical protein
MVVRNMHDVKCAPACWDGSDDPLAYDAKKKALKGLEHIPNGSYLTCIGRNLRPWMNSTTFVGIDCLYEDKVVWFLVDTNETRDLEKSPFGFDLIRIDANA